MGIVEIRHGFGTHVGPMSLAPMIEDLAETDRAFHATLYRCLGNVLLCEVLEAFWDAFHRVRTDLADVPQDPLVTCRQHREIVHAARPGDAVRAEETIREHFGNIRARLSTTDPQLPHRHPNKRV